MVDTGWVMQLNEGSHFVESLFQAVLNQDFFSFILLCQD